MQYLAIGRVMGLLLLVFALTFIPPWVIGVLMGDATLAPFEASFLIALILGSALFLPLARHRRELKLRDGILVVVLFWVMLGLMGAVPFYLEPMLKINFSQAVFESVSGFTTTGSTVLVGLDQMPKGILFYRQQLQWLGGLGIIVLVVAFMPLIGVGGMQLYKTEVSGPMKDERVSGRIADTAKALWLVYAGITVACALLFKMEGMSWFDAVGHAFSTVSTGGFSTHDASFSYFNNFGMELTAEVFMLLGATPMALHYLALRHWSLRDYARSSELKFFGLLLLVFFAILAVTVMISRPENEWLWGLRWNLFQLITLMTTTGFGLADNTPWPLFLPVLLLATALIGGCAGSTSGGLKVVRTLLLSRQGLNELRKLVHPHGEFVVKLGGRAISPAVISAVWAFFAVYVFVFMVIFFLMMATGLDVVSAFGATIATLTSAGPGLGSVAGNFATVSTGTLWVGTVSMLLGRLEIFTVLVLFVPMFWRR